MLKKILIALTLSLLVLLGSYAVQSAKGRASQSAQGTSDAPTGTLQKMIVENGSVTLSLDLNRLNGVSSSTQDLRQVPFAAGANSFFPILVFNDSFRAIEPGSISLIPAASRTAGNAGGNSMAAGVNASRTAGYSLPAALSASLNRLVVEKLVGQGSDLAVRDSNTGFTFFNVQGLQYDYDASAQSLAITNGRLLLSKEFANALGRPSDAGSFAGTIAVGATMQPIQIAQLANGQPQSLAMPTIQHAFNPAATVGPDVIVGDIEDIEEDGNTASQVGLDIGTDSCNIGDQPVDWFALPNTDHPVVPQNLYRMSGPTNNNDRIEQIGQSWMKHTFEALEESVCNTCNTSGCQTGTHLCPSCSDPYCCGLNGIQDQLGSRAWINPFTGGYPQNPDPMDHNGHVHDDVSHRLRVNVTDLNQSLNQGSLYFAEAAYIAPSEFTWCQTHPGQCNMYNNVSYRQFSVSGNNPPFSFSTIGSTVRQQPAIMAWAATGAVVSSQAPDTANDGIWFMGYKVTNPSAGVWHYEYALYNENLDRSIQSFSVPLGPGVNVSNIDFHAPPQEPGWTNDNIPGGNGYSSTPWAVAQDANSITWSSETFAQNQAANAIRFGTLYNFRFDADQPPNAAEATVGFFKTGSPTTVAIQAPGQGGTPTPTPTPSPSPTPTATPTPTPTPTPTSTPRPTPTPRTSPIPRTRPTPHPRP